MQNRLREARSVEGIFRTGSGTGVQILARRAREGGGRFGLDGDRKTRFARAGAGEHRNIFNQVHLTAVG